MKQPLSEKQLREHIADSLPAWRVEDNELVRVYETGNWRVTMLLAGMIAYLAEAANHHPDLLLTYPRVTVRLSSHDAGGITGRDLDLARRIEEAAVGNPPDPGIHTHAPKEWVR
ncbi:MAG: 4a-hydroxytetrahydrobiopterin dehydratase [Gemmatimonadota bacterium]|nr:4a-hydroxytetrahydrobiopterin dehydratase [Gemmatimonadota bacterium]